MLHKSIPALIKDIDAHQGIVTVYASSFNIEDDGQDIVRAGAFTKSINEWGPQGVQPRIKWLWQHDSKAIIGKPIELLQDEYGLLARGQAAPTTLGKDTLILYEYKVITEHSIGYDPIDTSYDRNRAVRNLLNLKLYEYSSVTWGMNSQTPTVSVKSADGSPDRMATLAAHIQRLDDCLHNATFSTDEIPLQLERQYKSLSALLPPAESSRPWEITTMEDKAATNDTPATPETPAIAMPETPTTTRKARDFNTLFQALANADDLQDEWGDTFIAFTQAMEELMGQAVAQMNGWLPENMPTIDAQEATQANLDAFSKAVLDLVQRSIAASFAPCLDDDGDQFLDPDGCNASDSDDSYGMMSATIAADVKAFRQRKSDMKAGRTVSAENHATLTKAMNMIGEGHKALSEFVKANNPANMGDEPPQQSDSVYDPGFGKSRAGAPSRHASATTRQRAGANSARVNADATTHDSDTDTNDDVARFKALMADIRQGAKEHAPVAG